MGGQRSLKEQLLALAALRTDVVVVGDVRCNVREVGALEFAEYGRKLKADRLGATAELISACVVDDEGNVVFTVEEAKQFAKSARVSMPIVRKIMELSGFGDDEKEPDAS